MESQKENGYLHQKKKENGDHVEKHDESNYHQRKDSNQSKTLSSSSSQNHTRWPSQSLPPQVYYPPEILPPNSQFPGYVYAPAYPGGYRNPSLGPHYESPHRKGRCSCGCKCFLIFLIIVVVLLVISRIALWANFLPRFPEFRAESMSVSDFNSTANPFSAKWDINVTVRNPNGKLNVYLDRVEGFVNYNDKSDVGTTWVNPLSLEPLDKTTMKVVVMTDGSAHHAVPIWAVQDMGKDIKNAGAINFVLNLKVKVTMKWNWFKRNVDLNVRCNDLRVNFGDSTTQGTSESKKRDDCNVKT